MNWRKQCSNKKIIFDNRRLEKSKRDSSIFRCVIITWTESIEKEYYEACTGLICKKLNEMVQFLQSYDLQEVKFSIHSHTCEVGVWYGIVNWFRSNPMIVTSKLTSYALAQLIWCSYFEQKRPFYYHHHRMFRTSL